MTEEEIQSSSPAASVSRDWAKLKDEEFDAIAKSMLEVGREFLRTTPAASDPQFILRLDNSDTSNEVLRILSDCVAARVQAVEFADLDNEVHILQEAKTALKNLKKVSKLLKDVPVRSREQLVRSSRYKFGPFSLNFENSLEDAIEFFQARSRRKTGRKFNYYINFAIEPGIKAFEHWVQRPFKKSLAISTTDRKASDWTFTNRDVLFIEKIMKTLDPTIHNQNIQSALQWYFLQK